MPSNYIKINFEKIKGYNMMGANAQMIFRHVYKKHNSCIGEDLKNDWKPVKVAVTGSCLRVDFSNGEWLHYYANVTWG